MSEFFSFVKKIKFHSLTWLLVGLSLLTAQFTQIVMMLAIVLVHELGHGLMARHYGWQITKMTILPFGGEMETSDFGYRPLKEEILVILAGPFQHVLLFFIGMFCFKFSFFEIGQLTLFQEFNLIVLITNLLPIWPLDGGKLVFLIMSKYTSFICAHLYTLRLSIVGVVIFICTVVIYAPFHLNSWLFACFMIFSIWKEFKQHSFFFMRFLLKKTLESGASRQLLVEADECVMTILKKFHKNCIHEIIVKKEGQLIGCVTEKRLLDCYFTDNKPFMGIGNLIDK